MWRKDTGIPDCRPRMDGENTSWRTFVRKNGDVRMTRAVNWVAWFISNTVSVAEQFWNLHMKLTFLCVIVHIESCDLHWSTIKNNYQWKEINSKWLRSCSRGHHTVSWRRWTGIFNLFYLPLPFICIYNTIL